MEEDADMVQSIGGPCPAARSNHTQADHSRERVTLTRHTPPLPGGDHPHLCEAFPHGRLSTYGGGKVGGAEITGVQVVIILPDARRASLGVAKITPIEKSGRGREKTVIARGEGGRG